MAAFALSLVSGLSWGIADFIAGLQSRRVHVLTVLAVSQPFGLVLVLVLLPLFGGSISTGEIALAMAGGVGGVLALGAFYRALAIGTMSVVAPIASTGVVIPVAFGLAQGDAPSTIQLAGVACAVTGVIALGRAEGGPEPPGADARGSGRSSIGLALVAAAGFGGFFVFIDAASEQSALMAVAAARTGGAVPVLIAFALVRPAVPRGGAIAPLLAIGLFDVLANVTFAVASTMGLLALVAVGGSLYPAFTILFAHTILGERLSRGQRRGVLLALAGVIAIAGGG